MVLLCIGVDLIEPQYWKGYNPGKCLSFLHVVAYSVSQGSVLGLRKYDEEISYIS